MDIEPEEFVEYKIPQDPIIIDDTGDSVEYGCQPYIQDKCENGFNSTSGHKRTTTPICFKLASSTSILHH